MLISCDRWSLVVGSNFWAAGGSGHRRNMETGEKYPAADADESNSSEAICTGRAVQGSG